jgi:uncharacterized protein
MPDGAAPPEKLHARIGRHLAGFARRTRLFGLSRSQFWRLVLSFALAVLAGYVFVGLRLPLPWMLGPLTISLIASALDRPLERPSFLMFPMRALLGVAIGGTFTPALAGKAAGTIVSLLLLAPYMALVTVAGVIFLERVAKFDRPTAFFSAAPGGLADMVIMSQDAGANLRRVTLVQAARVLMIVFVLPFWLQFVGGQPIGGMSPRAIHISELLLVDAVLIVALAWVGWRIAERFGLVGASMVGPMLLSGLVHGLGLTTAKVPLEILILAQIVLGIVIGGHFVGISLREFTAVLSWGLAFATLLIALAGLAALAISALTGLESTTLLLSYAPGGQNEMALLALILGLDVAVIALHHLLRVAMVVIGAQIVFSTQKGWRKEARD